MTYVMVFLAGAMSGIVAAFAGLVAARRWADPTASPNLIAETKRIETQDRIIARRQVATPHGPEDQKRGYRGFPISALRGSVKFKTDSRE